MFFSLLVLLPSFVYSMETVKDKPEEWIITIYDDSIVEKIHFLQPNPHYKEWRVRKAQDLLRASKKKDGVNLLKQSHNIIMTGMQEQSLQLYELDRKYKGLAYGLGGISCALMCIVILNAFAALK